MGFRYGMSVADVSGIPYISASAFVHKSQRIQPPPSCPKRPAVAALTVGAAGRSVPETMQDEPPIGSSSDGADCARCHAHS